MVFRVAILLLITVIGGLYFCGDYVHWYRGQLMERWEYPISAFECYMFILEHYPQSSLRKAAEKRIIYLVEKAKLDYETKRCLRKKWQEYKKKIERKKALEKYH